MKSIFDEKIFYGLMKAVIVTMITGVTILMAITLFICLERGDIENVIVLAGTTPIMIFTTIIFIKTKF